MNAHQSLSHTNDKNDLSLACIIVIDGEVTRLLPNKRSIDVHSITRDIMMIIYVRSTIVAGVSVFFCVQAEGKMLSIKKGPVSCKCSEMVTFVLLLLSTFLRRRWANSASLCVTRSRWATHLPHPWAHQDRSSSGVVGAPRETTRLTRYTQLSEIFDGSQTQVWAPQTDIHPKITVLICWLEESRYSRNSRTTEIMTRRQAAKARLLPELLPNDGCCFSNVHIF